MIPSRCQDVSIGVSAKQRPTVNLVLTWSTTDIWYGPKSQDVRWVPYKYLDQSQIADSNDVELYDPEKESQANKTAMNTPPDADKLPLEFSKLFKTSQRRKDNAEALEFMRNKHIMIYGSS